MSYRSLLVPLDTSAACSVRTQFAIQLAKQFGCHLIGLAPTDLVDLPNSPRSAASLQEYAARVWSTLRDQADHVARVFSDACEAAGLASHESIVDEAAKEESLARHAGWVDMVVLSQADPDASTYAKDRAMVEDVLLRSGRPALVVPCRHGVQRIGDRVLVAWNDTREATRAIADALPLLQRAREVSIVRCSERSDADPKLTHRQLDAIQRWLQRHGVQARVHVETSTGTVSDALLAYAAATRADSIVMGAYGHARLTELVLGGATRGILSTMNVPVLMSH